MEQQVHFALCFYHGSCMIRDSIEYCLPNRKYSVDAFYTKKHAIEQMLRDDSYLAAFCKANGEKGEEIRKNVQAVYDLIYNSNYIRIEDGNVYVDQTKNVQCIKAVVGVKLTLTDICMLHLNHLKDQQHLEIPQKYYDLINVENEFFGCVSTMVIAINCFKDRFLAFNKAMVETKGEAGIESNFISNEIQMLVSNASLVRSKTENLGDNIKKVVEAFSEGNNLMTGVTPLKVDKDHKLESNFDPCLEKIQQEVNKIEPKYKKLHMEVMQEMVDFERNMQQNAAEVKNEKLN